MALSKNNFLLVDVTGSVPIRYLAFLYRTAKFHLVHIQSNEEVMHGTRAGEAQRLAGQAFDTGPQREVLALESLRSCLVFR